jgi:hypothetical protein
MRSVTDILKRRRLAICADGLATRIFQIATGFPQEPWHDYFVLAAGDVF